MGYPFPLLQQLPGSQSCLPTCVCAVLRWHGQRVTREQASQWGLEFVEGCEFFLALQGLQDEGFDVKAVEEEEALLEMFAGDDPEPVIVMIRTPAMRPNSDHAVVIHAIRQQDGVSQVIDYMDPIDGMNHQDRDGSLLRWWNLNGSRAFLVRP